MKAIHEILGIDTAKYEDMVFAIFLVWAQGYAVKPNDIQNIIANAAIARWFRSELSQLEEDFKEEIKGFESNHTITALHLKTLYHRSIVRIYILQPKPLITQARKVPLGCTKIMKHGLELLTPIQLN